MKEPLIILTGPTAVGKTHLSIALAKAVGGEIISADSMQIYRGLDVGTAKVTPEETQGVPHHLVDIVGPEQSFSVADYVQAARACAEQIAQRGNLPFVVGGTGLYLSSLLNGIQFTPHKPTTEVRATLEQELAEKGREALYEELCRLDPEGAACVHPNNTPRLLRALELYRTTGRTMSQQKAASRPQTPPYHALLLILNDPDREALYRRIDSRVDRMAEQGLLEEARRVWQNRECWHTAAQAIGYKELFPYFEREAELGPCLNDLKQASRRYAKRQLTWFRRMEGAHWLDVSDPETPAKARQLVECFLNGEL